MTLQLKTIMFTAAMLFTIAIQAASWQLSQGFINEKSDVVKAMILFSLTLLLSILLLCVAKYSTARKKVFWMYLKRGIGVGTFLAFSYLTFAIVYTMTS